MSADYVKVYAGFFEGSLRDQPPFARLLFLAMLTHADPDGVALGAPSFWAAYVGITVEEVAAALTILSSPDSESTTPDCDGRRIEPWGEGANRWRIVNYSKYYERSRTEDRKAYKAEWIKQKRASSRLETDDCRQLLTDVDSVDPERKGKEIEKRTTFSKSKWPDLEEATQYFTEKGSSPEEAERFWNFYESKGWKVGKNPMVKWRAAATNWISRNPSVAVVDDFERIPPKRDSEGRLLNADLA